MTGQNYPEYHSHLRTLLGKLGKELQGPMAGFGQLHKAAVADGALSAKFKELIALAIAVSARCEGCIAFHTHSALKAGASRPEILEPLGVAVKIRHDDCETVCCSLDRLLPLPGLMTHAAHSLPKGGNL